MQRPKWVLYYKNQYEMHFRASVRRAENDEKLSRTARRFRKHAARQTHSDGAAGRSGDDPEVS